MVVGGQGLAAGVGREEGLEIRGKRENKRVKSKEEQAIPVF